MLMIFVCTLLALLKCKKCSNYRINVIIYTGIFCLLLNMIVDNLENWFPVFLMFCLMENSVHICKNMHEEKILLIQKKQSVVK